MTKKKQVGVMGTGPGAHLAAHDERAQIFLPRHPAHRHLFFKVCQLLFVQTQRDHMLPFPHRASSLPVISSRLLLFKKNEKSFQKE